MAQPLRRLLFGAPRRVDDPRTYHQISLVAFLAWVGLGADGLSSSSYGPEESFKALGQHHYLALGLAVATALTVAIISYSYTRIIEHFPFGGGGYVVASKLLSPRFGVVSGAALLVDYVLTISTSIAAGADACFSFLPESLAPYKLGVELAAILLLMMLNLRGVRESVTLLMPIFLVFLVTHALLIGGTIVVHLADLRAIGSRASTDFQSAVASLGVGGVAALFLRAYSMGAGTYTGIEAVSNGLQIMREPKVETAKRTMFYMALSLAVVAGGITLCYLLARVNLVPGKTLNAVLAEGFSRELGIFARPFEVLTLAAETALLFVAAQTGFIDGPRVMANMANDAWLPTRFAQLSVRLVMLDGVVLISSASILTLLYTGGDISTLVLMYSINVFLTFSLSQLGMVRFWFKGRRTLARWGQHISVHVVGLLLCVSILAVSLYEKFSQGGWVTLVVTSVLVGICFAIRRHYEKVAHSLRRLDEVMEALPQVPPEQPKPLDPSAPTAVLLVARFAGLGIHALLTVQRLFPGYFKNVVFVSVGVIDSARMKGVEEVEQVRAQTEENLRRYVQLAQSLGMAASSRMSMGTETVPEAQRLCQEIAKEFPRAMYFAGKLIFQREGWTQRLLHNETAYVLQRRLQFAGLNAMVLPVRVLVGGPEAASA